MVRFWEFFLYSGYKFFIRYKVCKHFLPVCSLFFHFLSCWSLNLSYIPPYYSQLQECLIISKPHINSWNDLIYFRPLLSGMQMLQAQGACLFSVQFNHSVVSDSLRPHESQHTRPSCPSEELTHWKRPWCWERLGAGGKGDDRGWDGWMASPTWWTWVWVNSGRWWWTGRPGMLRFMRSQRVGHDWVAELNWKMIFINNVLNVIL